MRSVLVSIFAALALLAAAAHAQPSFDDKSAPAPSGFGAPLEPEVTFSSAINADTVAPGDQVVLAFVLDHLEGWHSWPNAEVELDETLDFAIRTTLEATVEGPAALGPVQWPETKLSTVPDLSKFDGSTLEAPTFAGRAIIYLPVIIQQDAEPGTTLTISATVGWQACDDVGCAAPDERTVDFELNIVSVEDKAALTPAPPINPEDFAKFDPSVFSNLDAFGVDLTATTQAASSNNEGSKFLGLIALPPVESPAALLVFGLLAAVGGFVLNLTPCVLPVIPIKVMTISHHAGSPGKSLILGFWMALGVVAFWFGIGLPVAFLSNFTDPSALFGLWYVTLGIGLAIAVFGFGIMGLFSINLPQSVQAVNPKADSPHGSFLFGVMTAVLGLPCFGFVAGALLAGSATMPKALVLTIFGSIGVGMALPYLVLAAKPNWVDKIPRTGPASDLVKQVMGLLMIAAGAYFIGSGAIALVAGELGPSSLDWWARVTHWWVIAAILAITGLWLLARTLKISPKSSARLTAAIFALPIAALGPLVAADQTSKARNDFWIPFTDGYLNTALAEGQVVVLDFTAEWCLNCKALEAAILNKSPVKDQLLSAAVAPVKADLTSNQAPGWQKLRDLGQTGIPTLAIFGPGLETPWISNAYTSSQVMDAIARARGETRAAEAPGQPTNTPAEPPQTTTASAAQ